MLNTLTLMDILSSNHNLFLETVIDLINYKVFNENAEEEDAIIETLDYLQTTVELYDINPNIEQSKELLELIREEYKNTEKHRERIKRN